MEKYPRATCFTIASMVASASVLTTSKLTGGAIVACPPFAPVVAVVGSVASAAGFWYAYDLCIYERNKRVKERAQTNQVSVSNQKR